MKWIKLFESFESEDKIDVANKIHAIYFIKKLLDNEYLKKMRGTREENSGKGINLIDETYYYKNPAKLVFCIIKDRDKPDELTLCMNLDYSVHLLKKYLKQCDKEMDSFGKRTYWNYLKLGLVKYLINKEKYTTTSELSTNIKTPPVNVYRRPLRLDEEWKPFTTIQMDIPTNSQYNFNCLIE